MCARHRCSCSARPCPRDSFFSTGDRKQPLPARRHPSVPESSNRNIRISPPAYCTQCHVPHRPSFFLSKLRGLCESTERRTDSALPKRFETATNVTRRPPTGLGVSAGEEGFDTYWSAASGCSSVACWAGKPSILLAAPTTPSLRLRLMISRMVPAGR